MEHDVEDTIIRPSRPLHPAREADVSDTIVRPHRRREPAGVPSESPEASAAGNGSSEPEAAVTEAAPAAQEYGFLVGTHRIALDRPAYIGRAPTMPRVTPSPLPRLIRVPSPLGEVSGTHLELRQQGTMVIVTDLRSTNGTRVTLPGSPPVRLRHNESMVVTPGALIEIGDGNVVEVLSLRRAYPSGATPGAVHS